MKQTLISVLAFFGSFMQSLRPLIVLGIALGFVAVYFTHGSAGMWFLAKTISVGIVMNFAAWLLLRWIWRKARRDNAPKEAP